MASDNGDAFTEMFIAVVARFGLRMNSIDGHETIDKFERAAFAIKAPPQVVVDGEVETFIQTSDRFPR